MILFNLSLKPNTNINEAKWFLSKVYNINPPKHDSIEGSKSWYSHECLEINTIKLIEIMNAITRYFNISEVYLLKEKL